jgi:hypothetical protein
MEDDSQALTQSTSGIPTILSSIKDVKALAKWAYRQPDWPQKKHKLKDLKAMKLSDLQDLIKVRKSYLSI